MGLPLKVEVHDCSVTSPFFGIDCWKPVQESWSLKDWC